MCNLSVTLASLLLCFVPLFAGSSGGVRAAAAVAEVAGESSRHNNNWAVLVRNAVFDAGGDELDPSILVEGDRPRATAVRLIYSSTPPQNVGLSPLFASFEVHVWTSAVAYCCCHIAAPLLFFSDSKRRVCTPGVLRFTASLF